ncbi:LOW QUALITY PROTEIN: putative methyltransferase-like protein 24 [Ctenodactylus gundi]
MRGAAAKGAQRSAARPAHRAQDTPVPLRAAGHRNASETRVCGGLGPTLSAAGGCPSRPGLPAGARSGRGRAPQGGGGGGGTSRPPCPGRGPRALVRCLLGAAFLLGLRLCVELRRAPAASPARPRAAPGPPPPRAPPRPPPRAPRGQVTYVRRARRTPEPRCCAPRARPRSVPRSRIELQPWAGPARSLDEEASRFLTYISTVQIVCEHVSTEPPAADAAPPPKPWPVCLDDRFALAAHMRSEQCRLYSVGLGSEDTRFEVRMARDGCEVHRFDPSVRSPHTLQGQRLWHHRLSVDWRDPHPALAAHKLALRTRKLGSILNDFGHQQIDVLKANLESAEWKVLENLILEDVLEQIGQLVFEIHLHWPGFEVSGSDSSVVRFWYSLLKELERKDFRLFHSYKDLSKPQQFLEKDTFNASSSYTLSWVNMRWR